MNGKLYLFTYCLATLLATVVTPLLIHFAMKYGLHDQPNARSSHIRVTPRLGGIAIFIGTMALAIPFMFARFRFGEVIVKSNTQLIALLIGSSLMFAVGLIDDLKNLPARLKLLTQLVAAALVCWCGIRIDHFAMEGIFDVEFGWFSWPITMLWIAGVTNAVNFIDGLDGLAAGISAIACAVIALFSICSGNILMACIMLALLGGITGFLLFNFNPAKIFMGDCGSLFLGFTLATASVMCNQKSTTIVGFALPFLALGVPIFDMLFSMLRRILERRSMFAPDRGHIHHRLLDMGLHHRHVVLIIYSISIVASGFGILMMATRDVDTILVFTFAILLLIVVFRAVGSVRLRLSLDNLKRNMQYSRQQKGYQKDFENAQLLMRRARTFADWWNALCTSAMEMEMAYISLSGATRDNQESVQVWRNDKFDVNDVEKMVMLYAPVCDRRKDSTLSIHAAVAIETTLEAAGHKAALFTRLIDEYSLRSVVRESKDDVVIETKDRKTPGIKIKQ